MSNKALAFQDSKESELLARNIDGDYRAKGSCGIDAYFYQGMVK